MNGIFPPWLRRVLLVALPLANVILGLRSPEPNFGRVFASALVGLGVAAVVLWPSSADPPGRWGRTPQVFLLLAAVPVLVVATHVLILGPASSTLWAVAGATSALLVVLSRWLQRA